MNIYLNKSLRKERNLLSKKEIYYIVSSFELSKNSYGGYCSNIKCYIYNSYYIYMAPKNGCKGTYFLSKSNYTHFTNYKHFDPKKSYYILPEDYMDLMKKNIKLADMFMKSSLFDKLKEYTIESSHTRRVLPGFIIGVEKMFTSTSVQQISKYNVYPNLGLDFLYFQDKNQATSIQKKTNSVYPSSFLENFIMFGKTHVANRSLTWKGALYQYYTYIFSKISRSETVNVYYNFALTNLIKSYPTLKILIGNTWYRGIIDTSLLRFEASLDSYPMSDYEIILNAVFYPYTLYMYEGSIMDSIYEAIGCKMNKFEKFTYDFLHAVYNRTCQELVSYISLGMTGDYTSRMSETLSKKLYIISKLKLKIPSITLTVGNKLVLSHVYMREKATLKYFMSSALSKPSHFNYNYLDSIVKISTEQKRIVREVIDNNRHNMILGEAGTGKSYITGIITTLYLLNNYTVNLLSPTGCATAVLRTITGKMVENLPTAKRRKLKVAIINSFISTSNASKQNTGKTVFILDEVSMINLYLFEKLSKLIPHNVKIILVGDNNQLRSINGDSIPNFLLFMEKQYGPDKLHLRVNHLREIFRSGEGSALTDISKFISQTIREKRTTSIFDTDIFSKGNVKLMTNTNIDIFLSNVMKVYGKLREEKPDDISYARSSFTIITPYRKSAENINMKLQESIKKYDRIDKTLESDWGPVFNLHDYVRCTKKMIIGSGKNKIELDNGKRGIVSHIDEEYIRVLFDGELEVEFTKKTIMNKPSISKLVVTYSTTIHNSQGSQALFIFCYIPNFSESRTFEEHGVNINTFLNNNMLYVMMTRSEKHLHIYSNLQILNKLLTTFSYKITFLKDYQRRNQITYTNAIETDIKPYIGYTTLTTQHSSIYNLARKMNSKPNQLELDSFRDIVNSLGFRRIKITETVKTAVSDEMEEMDIY